MRSHHSRSIAGRIDNAGIVFSVNESDMEFTMPAKKATPRFTDVDDYIARANPEARPHLEELRKLFTTTIPEAEEKISWNVPFYRYHGEVGGFDAFKEHVSFGIGYDILDVEREGLAAKGYKLGKGTIQIPFDVPVPAAEIERMLRARAKQNKSVRGAA